MGTHYHTWGSNSNTNHNYSNTVCTIGLTFGSVYLFSVSLNEINKIYLSNNNKDILHKYLIAFNGSIMLLSGLTFAYLTTKSIK